MSFVNSIEGCKWNADYTEIEIYFVAALIGSGGAGILISSLSIVADLIGKNKESSAFVYGLMSLVDKVSNGLYFSFFIILYRFYRNLNQATNSTIE